MPSNTKWRRRQNLHAILLGILLVATAVGLYLYADFRAKSELLPVTFLEASGKETDKFYLEIAATQAERTKGLMFRREGDLDRDEGMLFIFPREKLQSFWMKNTYLSLDMIFIDKDFRVVGLLENVPPLNEEKRSVSRPSTYIVELLSGVAAEHGIKVGMKLKLHGEIPKPL